MTDFQQVKQYLTKSDAVLATIIHEIGDLDLSRRLELSTQNHFGTLVFGIIGQRNAERVTINILKNMREKYGNESPTPQQILTTPKAELEQMVNSYKKADYLISLAENPMKK
jgi:3-methyladenine DNA glycosylase/8-oxoguanine DNA glycosylase